MQVNTNQEISYSIRVSPTEAKILNAISKKITTDYFSEEEREVAQLLGKELRRQMRKAEGKSSI